jgi:hypothetical protein
LDVFTKSGTQRVVRIIRIVIKLRRPGWTPAIAQIATNTQLLLAKRSEQVEDVVDVRKVEEYAAVVLGSFLLAFVNGEMDMLIHIFSIRFDCFDVSC